MFERAPAGGASELSEKLGRTVATYVLNTAFRTHPPCFGEVAGEEADLPQVRRSNIAKYMGRVGWDDDDASRLIPCGRLVREGAFTLSFKTNDYLFDLVHMGRNFNSELQHILVCGALLGTKFFVCQVVADSIGLNRTFAKKVMINRHGSRLH
jgi:hypothetical protein